MSPGTARNDETLLFLHIPKAAGTTLARIAERHVPASRQYRLGGGAQAGIERFNQLPAPKRAGYRYLAGHFPFGVHEQIPGPWAYLTFLRDPLERTASFYHFVRKQPDHPITQAMTHEQRESLQGFLSTCREPVFDNGQTRLLAGDWGQIPFGECGQDLLDRAMQNLDQIAVVGLCESFIPSLLLAADRFGWTRIGYHSLNKTPGSTALLQDPDVNQALRAVNQLDLKLYAAAKKRFETDCAARGPDFEQAVRDFPTRTPPPPAWRECLDRIQSRTPREWIQKAVVRLKRKPS